MKLSDKYTSFGVKCIEDLKIGDIVIDSCYFNNLSNPNIELYQIESIYKDKYKVFIKGVMAKNKYFEGTYSYNLFCVLKPKEIKPREFQHPLTTVFSNNYKIKSNL